MQRKSFPRLLGSVKNRLEAFLSHTLHLILKTIVPINIKFQHTSKKKNLSEFLKNFEIFPLVNKISSNELISFYCH